MYPRIVYCVALDRTGFAWAGVLKIFWKGNMDDSSLLRESQPNNIVYCKGETEAREKAFCHVFEGDACNVLEQMQFSPLVLYACSGVKKKRREGWWYDRMLTYYQTKIRFFLHSLCGLWMWLTLLLLLFSSCCATIKYACTRRRLESTFSLSFFSAVLEAHFWSSESYPAKDEGGEKKEKLETCWLRF